MPTSTIKTTQRYGERKKPKSGGQLHQTYRTTRCDETVYPNITWFQRLLSYWRTRMLTWLFRQKLLFLAMKAFIALVFVRNLTSTILMGSGTPGLSAVMYGIRQPWTEQVEYWQTRVGLLKSLPEEAFKWWRFKVSATQKAFYVLWQGVSWNSLQ